MFCKAFAIFTKDKLKTKMKNLVARFSNQLNEAVEIAKKATYTNYDKKINNIIIAGLGGSGIGGTIASELVSAECVAPITLCKDYFLPEFANENTLVIISSYSGNTEETLAVLNKAIEKNCKIVVVASGGEVIKIAKEKNLDHTVIPGGMPPRSCLGYSLTQLLNVLHFYKLIATDYLPQLTSASNLIQNESDVITTEAKNIAQKIKNKIPVIYSLGNTEGVSVRFRQQINENSKMLCWHHVLPEMNHNELVGWTEKNENLAIVIFRYENDFERTIKRLEICKNIWKNYTSTIIEIFSKGKTPLERAIYMVHIGDWISCYIADDKGIDATEVNIINHLKGELSKF